MELETLNCNHCGAPLSVPQAANFVTCNHCSTRLAIRRTASTTFTEQLERIESQQEQVLEKLSRLERDNRLAQIDRAWEHERQQYLITDKYGHRHEPSETMAMFGGLLVIGIGIVWTVFAASVGSPIAIFGIFFVLFGLGVSFFQYHKAQGFRAARRRYQRRRREAFRAPDSAERHDADVVFGELNNIPTPQQYLDQLGRQQGHDAD